MDWVRFTAETLAQSSSNVIIVLATWGAIRAVGYDVTIKLEPRASGEQK
jgi:hypothetical protein